jgi:hypothetical protein
VAGGDGCSPISGHQKLDSDFLKNSAAIDKNDRVGIRLVRYFAVAAISAPTDSESWHTPRAWRGGFLGLVECSAKHALESMMTRRRFKVFVLIPLAINWIHRMSWIGCDVDQVPTFVESVGHRFRSPA